MAFLHIGGGAAQQLIDLLFSAINHVVSGERIQRQRWQRIGINDDVQWCILRGGITGQIGGDHGHGVIAVGQSGQRIGRDVQAPLAIAANGGEVFGSLEGHGNGRAVFPGPTNGQGLRLFSHIQYAVSSDG